MPQRFLHGVDYCPEQWRREVWHRDAELMRKAEINTVYLSAFAWSDLEPREGCHSFGWLDEAFDLLEKRQIDIILFTPIGARPVWLAKRYPELLRVSDGGVRDLPSLRHNHCPTSPVYRSKVASINGRLAERYGKRTSRAKSTCPLMEFLFWRNCPSARF